MSVIFYYCLLQKEDDDCTNEMETLCIVGVICLSSGYKLVLWVFPIIVYNHNMCQRIP